MKAIDQFLTQRDERIKWEDLVRDTLETHEVLFDSFLADEKVTMNFNSNTKDIDISFTGKATDLQSFWRKMRLHGYKASTRPHHNEIMTYFGTYWSKPGCARVWMYFSSSVCTRVKVGEVTETVTRDVYEIRCGE